MPCIFLLKKGEQLSALEKKVIVPKRPHKMKALSLLLVFISGCSVNNTSIDDQSVIKVARGDKTYWAKTKSQIPIYPYRALKNRVDGCVNVSYIVNSLGLVEGLKVINAQPKNVFDLAALKAVKQYKYKETERNKQKLPVRTNEIVTFSLDYPDFKSADVAVLSERCKVE